MKLSTKFTILILTVAFFVTFVSPAWAACVPLSQSCDETTDSCCGFPDNICHTTGVNKNYCRPRNVTCGKPTELCCDSPNPPCADGLGCSGGYCPAAETCTITATATGGGMFNFGGVCPTHYQGDWDVFVDTFNLATGSGGNVSASGGPYTAGSYTVLLRCYGYYGVDQVRSTECTDGFTSAGPPGETCTDDCTGSGDCAAGETCDKSCDPNRVVGNCVSGPPPPPPGPCSGGTISTGLGCIPTKPEDLILRVLEIAIGTAGGIALLSVVFGGFKVLTSSGNPDAISEGKGMITSAIAGLALILFSVAILNIIGFNVLGIPFFNP